MSTTLEAAAKKFPLKGHPVLTNSGPAAKAKTVLASVAEHAASYADNVPNIQGYVDPDLTPQAQSEFRDNLLAAHHDDLSSRFAGLRTHLDNADAEAAAAAAPHKPVLNPNDQAQLARTDQAWNNVIRPQLDKGKSLEDMISVADDDGLLAIQRFAPSLVASDTPTGQQYKVPGILANLKALSDRRVVEKATGDAKAALDEEVATRNLSGAARQGMAAVENAAPRDVRTAALGVKRSAYAAGATANQLAQAEIDAAKLGAHVTASSGKEAEAKYAAISREQISLADMIAARARAEHTA